MDRIQSPYTDRNLISAVRVAETLRKQNPTLFQPYPVKVSPGLHEVIEQTKSIKIEIKVDSTRETVRGFLLKNGSNGDPSIIIISDSQTYCWQRFTVMKELCHVLTDTSDVNAKSAVQQLEEARKVKSLFPNPTECESYCELLASIILMPVEVECDIPKLKSQGVSDYDIADKVKMPEWIVSQYINLGLHEVVPILRKAF